jgi:hypothetical protein
VAELSVAIQAVSLACAVAGAVVNQRTRPHLKLYLWVAAYSLVNFADIIRKI